MHAFQSRVMEEKADLDVRRDRLLAFMNGEQFATLPVEEQDLLARQSAHMAGYSQVLAERIRRFDFKS